MGSRCWDCGTKMGRCYEHGSSDCDCIGCACDGPKWTAKDHGDYARAAMGEPGQ